MICKIFHTLHNILGISIIISTFFLESSYLLIIPIIFLGIILGWIFNEKCFLYEYELFIKCKYDEGRDICVECNIPKKNFNLNLNMWFVSFLSFLCISYLRYIYNYNFINVPTLVNTILYSIVILNILLLFILLLVPSIHHYIYYKNKKQLILYLICFIVILFHTAFSQKAVPKTFT